jgi:hypothetical protein
LNINPPLKSKGYNHCCYFAEQLYQNQSLPDKPAQPAKTKPLTTATKRKYKSKPAELKKQKSVEQKLHTEDTTSNTGSERSLSSTSADGSWKQCLSSKISPAWSCGISLSPSGDHLVNLWRFANIEFGYSSGITIPPFKLNSLIDAIDAVVKHTQEFHPHALQAVKALSNLAPPLISNEQQLTVLYKVDFGNQYLCRLVYWAEHDRFFIDVRKAAGKRGACIPAAASLKLLAAAHLLPSMLEQAGHEFE